MDVCDGLGEAMDRGLAAAVLAERVPSDSIGLLRLVLEIRGLTELVLKL